VILSAYRVYFYSTGVKVKVKVKLTLEETTKAQRVRRGIALLYP
jgi:hypothetical protein